MNWIKQVDNNQHHWQQNHVHDDAQAGKVGETERTWTVHQHVGGTANGGCKAKRYAEHE